MTKSENVLITCVAWSIVAFMAVGFMYAAIVYAVGCAVFKLIDTCAAKLVKEVFNRVRG